MKRFITFGSIEQFRSVVRDVKQTSQYIGVDKETNEAMFDRNIKLPKIKVIGSEKIHGTNASVCYSEPDGFWVQSRKNIITPENDNAGCAFFAYHNKDNWLEIILELAKEYSIDLTQDIISVYFEWAGGNIQKKSALSGLDKKAMIFKYFKVSPLIPTPNVNSKWYDTCKLDKPEVGIYNIMNFPTVELEIDFNDALMSQNQMIKMVSELEPNSKVGQKFGVENNIGEGYVFTFEFNDKVFRFKVKGELHSKSKVKTLKPVDEVLENKKRQFVNEVACVSWRLEQMFKEVVDENENLSTEHTGDFIRKVIKDVIKEESDLMAEQQLEPKSLNPLIAKVSKDYFFNQLDNEL